MLMHIDRKWADLKNVVGFAAECARLALPFYEGDRRENLIAAIEAAEENVIGETVCTFAYSRAEKTRIPSYASKDVIACVRSVSNAARVARRFYQLGGHYFTKAAIDHADNAAQAAVDSGADIHGARTAFARWVVRDLSGGRELPAELRQAAGAAVVAGNEDLARALVQEEV